jgi:LuxR family transcriptional regulator, maltose regulon positive regulatory protein
MTTVLIEAKFRSPNLRSAIVSRPRLVERLATTDSPVGVVVAPPGFGKTTLLVQWQASDERPFAWLSLDDGDNDPIAFWSCLVASIGRVVPDFGSSVGAALDSMGGLALDATVARILNEIDALDRRIVVVLDDYHRITSPECHGTLATLLERLPSAMQLIISTRSDPPLPLAQWRVGGRLTELQAADLAFTDTEAADALNQAWGRRTIVS